jgi:hypothetical protein
MLFFFLMRAKKGPKARLPSALTPNLNNNKTQISSYLVFIFFSFSFTAFFGGYFPAPSVSALSLLSHLIPAAALPLCLLAHLSTPLHHLFHPLLPLFECFFSLLDHLLEHRSSLGRIFFFCHRKDLFQLADTFLMLTLAPLTLLPEHFRWIAPLVSCARPATHFSRPCFINRPHSSPALIAPAPAPGSRTLLLLLLFFLFLCQCKSCAQQDSRSQHN